MKNNKLLYILTTVFLTISILGLMGYIIYEKNANENNIPSNNPEVSTGLVSKLIENKDWIYDADYEKNVNADSYTTQFEETYYSKDIIVPYINIKSYYATESNNEIKQIFNDLITEYNNGIKDNLTYIDECHYEKYLFDNILSVVFTYGIGATDVVNPNYYTYNIDLKSGNKLSYEQVYKIAGLDSNNILSKVKSTIADVMNEKMINMNVNQTEWDNYYNASIDNYTNSLKSDSIKYFLDNEHKLNIVVELIIPEGYGKFNTLIAIH